MKTRLLSILSIVCLSGLAGALADEDNFDRESGPLGDNWEVLLGNLDIQGEGIVKKGEAAALAVWKPLQTVNDGSAPGFKISADVSISKAVQTMYAGVAFHVQDADNYYTVRFNGLGNVQFFRIINGGKAAGVQSIPDAFMFTPGQWYRIEVTSDTPYHFHTAILDASDGKELWSGDFVDPSKSLKNGKGGILSISSADLPAWDNFRLETLK